MSSSYEFFYFELHGLGLTSRTLLSLGGFEWKNRYPETWAEEKSSTPLGKLPVLTETRPDGSKFVLAESNAINRYLARKAGLFGTNEDEAALIDQFGESWMEIVTKGRPVRLLKEANSENHQEELSKYLETTVKPILAKHEVALAKNGTGYYVGDKLSLADVQAKMAISHINSVQTVIEQSYPHIWKLYQNVSSLDAVKIEAARFPPRK